MTLITHVVRTSLLKSIFLIFSLLITASPLLAQIRCATDEVYKKRHARNPQLENTEQFEKWMKAKMALMKANRILGGRTEDVTYTIPVVVHILHNGEAIGTGTNLSDAQIFSQIAALNRDFPRLNADSVNTPAEFQPVAGKIKLNFVLAKQDPEGIPSNGITRTKSTKSSWTSDEDHVFKALIYWPAEDYLNIWVVDFSADPQGVVGLAELPVSSGLPGLESASFDRLIDGVAIHYQAFGDGNWPTISTNFNKGRTGTHEVGHIFGLRHIWQDEQKNCTGTDYCADTPTQDGPTFGCPSHPQVVCTTHKMFQNYMDYTNDACYNLFTKDQVGRMVTVLNNSPRRASLLLSPGAQDPTLVSNNLGLRKIIYPDITACSGVAFIPKLQVRNYGNNNITAAKIQLKLNGSVIETKDFTLNLAFSDTVNVTFSPVALSAATNNFVYTELLTNGVADGDPTNDVITQTVIVPVTAPLPLVETFNTTPANWIIINPDGGISWQNAVAPYSTTSNRAMYMNFYDYDGSEQIDKLIAPVINLSTVSSATLKFDLSYAFYSAAYPDQLKVLVSSSCDSYNTVEIFNRAGAALATTAKTTSAFTPKSSTDWATITIPLTQFLGQPNVQIQFVAVNKNGNNLYLDNVAIITDNFTDLAINALKSPAPVICTGDATPVITVTNNGTTVVTGFTVTEIINTSTVVTNTYTGVSLALGDSEDFALAPWSLKDGLNSIKMTIQPSTNDDVVPINNVLNLNVVVNNVRAVVPFREDFNSDAPGWSAVSPTQNLNWVTTTTGDASKVLSYEYNAFANAVIGSQAWLASPVLDLSNVSKAGFFFDLSYAKSTLGDDRLQVLGSTDCGLSYTKILFDQTRDSLAYNIPEGMTNTTNSSWTPQNSNEWKSIPTSLKGNHEHRPFVSLDSIVGASEARFAFVATNGHGNNIFLDNVEIFLDDSSHPVLVDPLFSVYNNMKPNFKITFNLPETESVHLQVVNTLGQVMIDDVLNNVLNQTFDVNLQGSASGIYIVRLQIGSTIGTAKVSISN